MNTDEKNYGKRELDMKFLAIEEKIDSRHDETMETIRVNDVNNKSRHEEMFKMLESIKADTMKHNGRLTKQESWTRGIVMSGSVALFLGCTIVGLIIYIYQYQLSIESTRITNLKSAIQILQVK